MDDRDTTIICRCEDLTLRDVQRAIDSGCKTLDEIKRLTRCGMGPCQGRTCRPLVSAQLSRVLKMHPSEITMTRFRPPTKPIKLKALALLKTEAGDEDHD